MRRRPGRVQRAPTWTPNAGTKSARKIPLKYVVLGVTLYCAVAWTVVIVGINAGMRALQKPETSFAASTLQTTR